MTINSSRLLSGDLYSISTFGDNQINTFFMKLKKTDSLREKKFMPGMFEIMLIIGIIYNTLKITFVISDPESADCMEFFLSFWKTPE